MQDTELTPALERVTASVAETHRKREQVEQQLQAAAAVLESLSAQSTSLEGSVRDLRSQLEQTIAAKTVEDASLAELARKRQAALEELGAIARDAQSLLAEKDRLAGEVATHADASRTRLSSVQEEVKSTKSVLTGVGAELSVLQIRLSTIRDAVEAAFQGITESQSKAKDLDGALDAMAARAYGVAENIEHADRARLKVLEASKELQALTSGMAAKGERAKAASASMSDLAREHEQRTAALAGQLAAMSTLVSPKTNAPSQPNGRPSGSNTSGAFADSISTLELLAAEHFIEDEEAARAIELLQAGDADKLVRSMWSRAMAGSSPAVYRLIMGEALLDTGDRNGAHSFFSQVLAARNVDPFILYLVARAMLRMKKYVEVLKIAQLLSRVKPGRVLGRNLDGLHSVSIGRLDEAQTRFSEALGMTGYPKLHHQETMYNLGCLLESKGDVPGAVVWYEKLRSDTSSYRNIAVHIKALESGSKSSDF